jgi:thiamine-monophosphate kinase
MNAPREIPPSALPASHGAEGDSLLSELGERAFIQRVQDAIRHDATDDLVMPASLGIGDDAAVIDLPGGDYLIATVDAMVEGTHFRRDMPAEGVGYRLAASNVSDLAAMGGAQPVWALLTFGAPGDLPLAWVDGFLKGLAQCAREFGFPLVGGDTVRSPQVFASLTLVGQLSAERPPVPRSNAKPGHYLYVSGSPGESAAGLRLLLTPDLEKGLGAETSAHLKGRHLYPSPRLVLGQALAEVADELSLIDVSDGVFNETELMMEASQGVGAELRLADLPISSQLREFCTATDLPPHELVLLGGEDFELLFATTTPPDELVDRLTKTASPSAFRSTTTDQQNPLPQLTCIGRCTKLPGVRVLDETNSPLTLEHSFFSHF